MKKEQLYLTIIVLVAIALLLGINLWTKNKPVELKQVNLNLNQKGTVSSTSGLDSMTPISASDHIKGSLSAPVKIVVYSDLECPYCKFFHFELMEAYKEFGPSGQLAIVFRHFPIDSLHSKARTEAQAAECIAEIGGNDKFWLFLDKLFAETPSNNGLNLDRLPALAEMVGINLEAFQNCLDANKYANKIESSVLEAEKIGAQGTPYSVVITKTGKTPLGGFVKYPEFRSLITDGLK